MNSIISNWWDQWFVTYKTKQWGKISIKCLYAVEFGFGTDTLKHPRKVKDLNLKLWRSSPLLTYFGRQLNFTTNELNKTIYNNM